MGRPIVPPDWATSSNYPAGPDPWSNTPTKSTPSAGKVSTGYVPNTADAAEEDNFILNNHAEFIKYLDSAIAGFGLTVRDDFYDTAISSMWTLSGNATESLVNDNAQGATGAIQFDMTNPGIPASITLREPLQGIGAGDFALSARVRVLSKSTSGWSFGVFGHAGFASDGASPNWQTILGGTVTPTAVPVSSSYQNLLLTRVSGVVTYFINGASVAGSGSHAASIDGATLIAASYAEVALAAVRMDCIKFWGAR